MNQNPSAVSPASRIPARAYPITRADLIRYAGASRDFNVIHWNERVARSVGLPNVIAHGMLTMALGGRYLGEWAGDPGAITDYRVRFSRPVVVPDDETGVQVSFEGVVAGVADGHARIELSAYTEAGAVLTAATATVRLANPPTAAETPTEEGAQT
jgi:acyl dehydratase